MRMRILVGFVLAGISAASADVVDVKFIGKGSGQNVHIDLNGSGKDVFAGQLVHEFSNGTGLGSLLSGQKIVFCSDLTQTTTSSAATYEVVDVEFTPDPAMGASRAQAIYDLYHFAAGSQFDPNATNDFATAFQLAVWEVASDYDANVGLASLNLGSGSFEATYTNGNNFNSTIMNHLNDLFAAIGANAPKSGLFAVTNDFHQDQLVDGIPAPGPLALLSLAGLLVMNRRR